MNTKGSILAPFQPESESLYFMLTKKMHTASLDHGTKYMSNVNLLWCSNLDKKPTQYILLLLNIWLTLDVSESKNDPEITVSPAGGHRDQLFQP